MSLDKSGRVALITGSATGLGQAYAERLAADGASVVIADIGDGSETLALVERAGSQGLAVRCDVTDQRSVASCYDAVMERFGRLDILVNNAGIYPNYAFETMTQDQWDAVLAVNLGGTFNTCRAFIPGMAERGYGRVLNVSSRTFWVPSPDYTAYITAKAAVIGLSRALATDYGEKGVTVNVLAPGLTRTPANEQVIEPQRFDILVQRQAIKRPEVPTDLAGAVAFLTSDDAAFITGQTLMVDGGMVRL